MEAKYKFQEDYGLYSRELIDDIEESSSPEGEEHYYRLKFKYLFIRYSYNIREDKFRKLYTIN